MKSALFIAKMVTGLAYCDSVKEHEGDLLRYCFLPFGTLKPEWGKHKVPDNIRKEIEDDILAMQIRCGSEYPSDANGHTILLGQQAEEGLALRALMTKYPNLEPRDNCLEDMACPSCGHREAFKISMNVVMTLMDQGTEGDYGDTEWDENSYCQCTECKHEGIVANFTYPGLDDMIRDREP